MRKIIRYEILRANTEADLSKRVMEFINTGWELQGGVGFSGGAVYHFCQAVVKYEAA